MPDTNTENPLAGTELLEPDELRETYDDLQPTVDQLRYALGTEDYSRDQLDALETAEREDRDRKTAKEALAVAQDSLADTDTRAEPAGITTDTRNMDPTEAAEANSCDASPALQRAVTGAGATYGGDDPLCLPDPRSDDAPDSVRIVIDAMAVGFGGSVYDEGEHNVGYNKRVKQSLEAETNNVRLSKDDPLYPEKDDSEE